MTRRLAVATLLLLEPASACTTFVVGRAATSDGSVLASHSNDGDGGTAGNLAVVRAADWKLPAQTHGGVPQVAHTHAYYTKAGGYASVNEFQVGLAESTCVAAFPANRSAGARLNIVDLSALGLERATSARAAVAVMGELAERYGYADNGESLLVYDPQEAFVFHVLPDDTGASAVWVAERVPDDSVAVVANSFTVRTVEFDDYGGGGGGSAHHGRFLSSSNMRAVALRSGRWAEGAPLDFTWVFGGREPGHKYASGRRMWRALHLLAPAAAAAARLEPTYDEYVSSRPYPATLGPAINLTVADLRAAMRDYYQGTAYDLSAGLAAGPFGSPLRLGVAANGSAGAEGEGEEGGWERPIAVSRTIVSYVVVCRGWLAPEVGGVLWFGMHSALTTVYVPWPLALLRTATGTNATGGAPIIMAPVVPPVALPVAYTNNSAGRADRGVGAWQAARFVFTAAQLHFTAAIGRVQTAQTLWEATKGGALVADWTRRYTSGELSARQVAVSACAHATDATRAWWELSDQLMLDFSYPDAVYPRWWAEDVGYATGPGPSPEVPPPPMRALAARSSEPSRVTSVAC